MINHCLIIDEGYNSWKFYNYGWHIIGVVLGTGFIFSICLNVYCLVKRKRNSGMVSEIPLEVHYDEIGTINYTAGNTQVFSNIAQEAATNIGRHAFERINDNVSSLDQEGSSDSSIQSVSILLLNEDEYEHPYQMMNPGNIEKHPYSTIWSNKYQNTTIFSKDLRTKNAEQAIQNKSERSPWLIIYKKSC